jgi:hypothetical protein
MSGTCRNVPGRVLTLTAALVVGAMTAGCGGAEQAPTAAGRSELAGGTTQGGVLQPPSHRRYGELSAVWWQWALAFPFATNPILDPTSCDYGNQPDGVFLLAGNFGGTMTRTCTVPAGSSIFVPIFNAECSDLEPPPFFGATPVARRKCAIAFNNGAAVVSSFSLTLDGVSLVGNWQPFRAHSADFGIELPVGSLLGNTEPVSGRSGADGWWALLSPLSPGAHTIRITSSSQDGSFVQDVTFNLTQL